MSMLFRDANGVEHPVAGLNGTSGELVPSVSHYQSGNKTSDTTSWSTGETGTFSINLSENMPDADYVVVPTLNVAGVSAIVHAKTANSFRVTVRNDRAETIAQAITLYWQAFKLMTDESRALDEQAIADIQAVIPSTATSANKLTTAADLASKQDTLVDTAISGTAASGVRIDYQANRKYGRIVQLGMSVTLTSDIGIGGTLITGLPPSCSWLAEVYLTRNGVCHGARINESGQITIEETIAAGGGLISGTYISAG